MTFQQPTTVDKEPKKDTHLSILVNKSIGKTGFEPATPWSQTKYSTKLSYFPNLSYYLMHPRGVEPLTA